MDALVQTREFSVCYHAFKRDFELDKEKSGNFAASRKFRMLPFGSAGCRAAADVLDKYMPPWALRLGDSEIEDNCAAKFHVSAKQYMSEQGISLHAMMKNDHYIGREWLGFIIIGVPWPWLCHHHPLRAHYGGEDNGPHVFGGETEHDPQRS